MTSALRRRDAEVGDDLKLIVRAVLAAAMLVMLAPQGAAVAGPDWCEEDPIVVVDGHIADLVAGYDGAYRAAITGAIRYEVHVPANVTYTKAYIIPGTVPQEVAFVRSLPAWSGTGGLPMTVKVSIPSTTDFLTRLTVTTFGGDGKQVIVRDTIYGTSTTGITASFDLFKPGW